MFIHSPSYTISNMPVPILGIYPKTSADDGVLILSVSLVIQLPIKYFIVVSKLIFKKGEELSSIPILLKGL